MRVLRREDGGLLEKSCRSRGEFVRSVTVSVLGGLGTLYGFYCDNVGGFKHVRDISSPQVDLKLKVRFTGNF